MKAGLPGFQSFGFLKIFIIIYLQPCMHTSMCVCILVGASNSALLLKKVKCAYFKTQTFIICILQYAYSKIKLP